MKGLKTFLATSAVAGFIAAGALVVTTVGASAHTVCNSYGECWQTTQRYNTYPSVLGIHFYSDSWARRHRHNHRYQWRDKPSDDHGYYDHGTWHNFGEDHH
ncbi:MAG: hypothetical protein ABSD21_04785 [Rhizomicrobium sp.]|jgi:hypothetical protein